MRQIYVVVVVEKLKMIFSTN
nr:unnamed protein product [Callosobruchus chinensis]